MRYLVLFTAITSGILVTNFVTFNLPAGIKDSIDAFACGIWFFDGIFDVGVFFAVIAFLILFEFSLMLYIFFLWAVGE